MKIATRAVAALLLVATAFAGVPAAQGGQGRKPAQQGQSKPQGQEGGRFKWWQDARYQRELGLTADQSAKINGIWDTTLPILRKIHQELETVSKELSRLVDENTAPESVVALQIDRVEARRSELEKARRLMIYRMHQVLSPAQHAKFKQLWAARDRRDRSPRQR
jgi:Spy/CpxP family protein refolding chaperone